ncbi:MAG TPA: EscU/YscU/HrcU family type III secretion system export apparatus switch protein [Acidimicrobiales bacterium]|nr:EscU/YscU/HrcU family type III secretion system export apparatus switch protein [Acidimicrobiales bacterium]
MASEDKHSKTEPPTAKRKKEARDRGQVARSHDVSGWAAVLAGTFILPWLFSTSESRVLVLVGQARSVMGAPTPQGAFAVLTSGLRIVVIVMVPVGILFALLAIVTNIAQTGRSFSLKAARPRVDRVSPKSGIKRLFGTQTLVQLGKQALKLAVLSLAGYSAIHGLARQVTGTTPVGLAPILGATASSILGLVRTIALLSVIIGLGEYFFQKRKLTQSLKMTKYEVKEEAKASEGNPYMKGELRKRQYAIVRSQIASAIRRADVVVTNPTHYAVALQYSPGSGGAPLVVAKGADALARAIRERATEAEVPIVEDAPLARYLYAVCEVDQQIPAEIYMAVARLLAFVYALPAVTRASRVHTLGATSLPEIIGALDALPPGRRERAAAMLATPAR